MKLQHRPKCKGKTIKLLEENKGVNFHDLELIKAFLDMTPKTQGTD